jgi:hypothetical protein
MSTQPEVKRARRTALVLATACILSILFLIFAFTQKLEADRQRIFAERIMQEAKNNQRLLEEQLKECQTNQQ